MEPSGEESSAAAGGAAGEEQEELNEALMVKALELMDKITDTETDNPDANAIHGLSSLLETQESRFMELTGHSTSTSSRYSHIVGRLGKLIRENDEFFELISSKFLSERRYSVSVQAAAARLLYSCSLTWMYPHVFEETVLENLKTWAVADTRLSGDLKHESGEWRSSDFEMLNTYSTGLLAVYLASGDQVVEDLLRSEFPAKLFQYLHIRSFGLTSTSQRNKMSSLNGKRSSNTPSKVIKAAGDTAAVLVNSAALEEFKKTNYGEATALAASVLASRSVDAAIAVEVSRSAIVEGHSQNWKATSQETNEDFDEFFILDSLSLANLKEKFCIQCLVILAKHVEALRPVLHEKGVDVCLALMKRSSRHKKGTKISLLPNVLKLISALAVHRKFTEVFVDRGGLKKLLSVPRAPQTFVGLSSCLITIGSVQGTMERLSSLSSGITHQVVELALQLLESHQDQPRKNAVLFLGAAFSFRVLLDAFDAQDGLQRLLNLLHDAASVRYGGSRALTSSAPPLWSERPPAEVLTSSEKQITYHTCVSLRQYFRAHLLLLVDSICPNKNVRGAAQNIPTVRASYKPLDISNEAMDAVFRQIEKDCNLGLAIVRARWPVVDKFLSSNGHIILLKLCQAGPREHFLYDLLQYALGILHIITLVPYSRKLIINATLSNDCVGIAVILDAANSAYHVEPKVVEVALNVLICLVCPPPSISNKLSVSNHAQQTASIESTNFPGMETRDVNAERSEIRHINAEQRETRDRITERIDTRERNAEQGEIRERNVQQSILERGVNVATQNENRNRESALAYRGIPAVLATSSVNGASPAYVSTVASGLVGDQRISVGVGAGYIGLAAQLEQGYSQAREAVRSCNGIKVLLKLLRPNIVMLPAAIDCLRALACRVLLGLARDDTIALTLTELQVGEKLSEVIQDSGNHTLGSEHNRWQAELTQVAIELIGVVTSSRHGSALAARDAASPTLSRIERAAIAAATPIIYNERELLLLIHEHLHASGLVETATTLLKEAQLTPLPSLSAPSYLSYQSSGHETLSLQIQWPSGRIRCGVMSAKQKLALPDEDSAMKDRRGVSSSKKKQLDFSSACSLSTKSLPGESSPMTSCSKFSTFRKFSTPKATTEAPSLSAVKSGVDPVMHYKTPIVLPMKRKLIDLKGSGFVPSGDDSLCSNDLLAPTVSSKHGHLNDSKNSNTERLTLDSMVVEYLKHQHRQCSAPITTLPPLSVLHPHVCPKLRRSIVAPSNVTSRLCTREFRCLDGGNHVRREDRKFVYSRFRPWRTFQGDGGAVLTCVSFFRDSTFAAGTHSGKLNIYDCNSNTILESFSSLQNPLTLLQSYIFVEIQLILSSSAHEVHLWDTTSVAAGPRHIFESCKAARFSNSGTTFAALSTAPSQREILLYDVHTCQLELNLSDTSQIPSDLGDMYSPIHFSPSDNMLLWSGVLWDRRSSALIHRFDQFTDYGGGSFHPAGNEVITNSEVWDLRNFRLLRSVPSLDKSIITFNAFGDVIYAIMRRNLEDLTSAFNIRRLRHPLSTAFRTVDAAAYSDIATIPLDCCVLDFATEPTDSFVGLLTVTNQDGMDSSARVYEIGCVGHQTTDSDP